MVSQDLQPGSTIPCLPGSPAIAILRGASPAQPLPLAVLDEMQDLFQADFSAIRIHLSPHASRLGIAAVAFGEDLYFAAGHYAPETSYGRFVLAHELQHIMQQREARVPVPADPLALVEDPALEAEADHMGFLAARMPRHKSRRASRRDGATPSGATLSSHRHVFQPLRIGKIPPANFQPNPLNQVVGPLVAYAQMSANHPQAAISVANFTDTVRTRIHYANTLYYNHFGNNPAAGLVPANLQASDENGRRLWLTRCFTDVEVEVDHIVPKERGGCNHYFNARLLSNFQNRPTNLNTSRPAANQFQIMCLENRYNFFNTGQNFQVSQILNLGQLNLLLQAALLVGPYVPDHDYNNPLPNLGAFSNNDFNAIYLNAL